MAATDINTVLTSQRMAAGTVGPTSAPISNSGALRLVNSFSKLLVTHSDGHQTG